MICLVNTHNQVDFIDECVDSCLAQHVPEGCDYAVHVLDLGSSDGTRERLLARGAAIVLHARDNLGQSAAFELCRDLDADLFLFCDGDDRIKPHRLARVLEAFAGEPGLLLVGNSITEIDAQGAALREVYAGADARLDAREGRDAARLHDARCLMGTSRMAVRKEALCRVLPFVRPVLFEADEYVFNLLPALGPVRVLAERLTDYRLHAHNSYQSGDMSLSRIRRHREVHEALLECLEAARARLRLSGEYVDRCLAGLRRLCAHVGLHERALTSRRVAFAVALREPGALGFERPSLARRAAFATIALVFGLGRALYGYRRWRAGTGQRPASVQVL